MKIKASTDFAYHIDYPTPIITILRPRPHAGQTVLMDEMSISPEVEIKPYQDMFGNPCQRMVWQEGNVRITTETIAEVENEVEKDETADYVLVENLPAETIQFLLPSRYCLSDTQLIRDKAYEIIKNIEIGFIQVEAIRKWLFQNIEYQYGYTFSHTNSNDILTNKIGVCRDFAHVGIALCRSINIPARMVVGFMKDLPFSDLHAWFEAFIGNRWYTFDAIQKSTTGGRIVLAYGRDANDVAFITQFGNMEILSMNVRVEEIKD
ncbi:MAG: transglutaminase family protein [Arcicella sp.]|nr:transglutaminase family protein [Arcicella sp.]